MLGLHPRFELVQDRSLVARRAARILVGSDPDEDDIARGGAEIVEWLTPEVARVFVP